MCSLSDNNHIAFITKDLRVPVSNTPLTFTSADKLFLIMVVFNMKTDRWHRFTDSDAGAQCVVGAKPPRPLLHPQNIGCACKRQGTHNRTCFA